MEKDVTEANRFPPKSNDTNDVKLFITNCWQLPNAVLPRTMDWREGRDWRMKESLSPKELLPSSIDWREGRELTLNNRLLQKELSPNLMDWSWSSSAIEPHHQIIPLIAKDDAEEKHPFPISINSSDDSPTNSMVTAFGNILSSSLIDLSRGRSMFQWNRTRPNQSLRMK